MYVKNGGFSFDDSGGSAFLYNDHLYFWQREDELWRFVNQSVHCLHNSSMGASSVLKRKVELDKDEQEFKDKNYSIFANHKKFDKIYSFKNAYTHKKKKKKDKKLIR